MVVEQRLGRGLGGVNFRYEVDIEMKLRELFRGGRADGRKTDAAKVADISKSLEKIVEELLHTVRAGEDDPVIAADAGDSLNDGLNATWRHDFDGWNLENIRAEILELARKHAGLTAGAGDHHPRAKERPVLKPAKRIPQD